VSTTDHQIPPEDRDARRREWDERHAAGHIESADPNPLLVSRTADLMPGSALDLGCGDGANAIWLARQGWRVTGVDWSGVALAKARSHTEAAGVSVEWVMADLLNWSPPSGTFDLVVLVFLHAWPDERRPMYAGAARAVAPGGRLLVIGHDRTNLTAGAGGPQDPERLFTAGELAAELTAAVPDLEVEEAATVRRSVPEGERAPIDALLRMRRRA
jgi:SAM-dependent methyltransferase